MSSKTIAIVLMAAAVAFLLGTLYTAEPAQAQVGGMKMPKMVTMVLEGNFRVHYDCQFMDKTKKKGAEEQVKKIEFHSQYITLHGQTGSGRVIPVHTIRELTWEQS